MASYHSKYVRTYYYVMESYSYSERTLQEQRTIYNFSDSHLLLQFRTVSQQTYVLVAHIALEKLLSLPVLKFSQVLLCSQ